LLNKATADLVTAAACSAVNISLTKPIYRFEMRAIFEAFAAMRYRRAQHGREHAA